MPIAYPSPPRIVINSHITSTSNPGPKTPTSPIRSRATPPRVQTPTATLINHASPRQCYLCDEQNPGDFSPTTKYLESCILCSRDFCPVHKATQWPDTPVCNINHSTYYHACLNEARTFLTEQASNQNNGISVPIRISEAEDVVMQDGVFPSIGERENSVFARSPISPDQKRQIEEVISLDAERRGTKGQRRSTLIETKSFIGADIAA